MSGWLALAPAALVVCAALWVPGYGVGWAVGLRGIQLLGTAPLLGGAVVGLSAIVAGAVGVDWSFLPVALGTVVFTAIAVLVRRWAGGWRGPREGTPGRSRVVLWTLVLVVLIAAVAFEIHRLTTFIGSPDNIAQEFDTTYHLNSIRLILDTHDGSSLHMTLAAPGASSAFYPALFHDLAALAIQVTGITIPQAANVVVIVGVAVVWPAAIVAMTRAIIGPRPVAIALAGAFAFAFTQYPNGLLAWGGVFPNQLAYAMVPAAIGLLVVIFRNAHGRGRIAPALTLGFGMVGLALAQPNAVFTLLVIVIPFLVQVLWRWSRRSVRSGRRVRVAVAWASSVAGLFVADFAFGHLPIISTIRDSVWRTGQLGKREAIREVFSLQALQPAGLQNQLMAALVVLGFVVCLVIRRTRWLSFAYLVVAGLAVVALAINGPVREHLVGYWYADPARLVAMLPIVGAPMAAIGVAFFIGWLTRLVVTYRGARIWVTAGVGTVVCALVVLGFPNLAVMQTSFGRVSMTYKTQPEAASSNGLLDVHEYRLLDELDRYVPASAAIAGDPRDGSALAWAFADRQTVFPAITSTMDQNQEIIAGHLDEANTNPEVCPAVRATDTRYVLDFGRPLGGTVDVRFDGLNNLDQSPDVVKLVAEDGGAKLYRVTACW